MPEAYLISPSQFRAHKDCSKLHEYIYGQQLRANSDEQHFLVGSYFHELCHFYYQLIKAGYVVGDPHTLSVMDSKLREDLVDIKPNFYGVALKVHLMFRRYLERRTNNIDKGIEIVEVEYRAEFTFDSGDVGLMGILDLLYRDKHGKLIIRDHKTGANKSAHSDESIGLDDQLLTYAIMIWQLFGEVPDIEISWVNSKVDYVGVPSQDQLFGIYYKKLTLNDLEAFWTYTQEYVYHMQSVPAIRSLNSYKCKNCAFRDPCIMSLKGLDTTNLLAANYKKVPRDHDYRKFTEIARKNSGDDSKDQVSDYTPGRLILNSIRS